VVFRGLGSGFMRALEDEDEFLARTGSDYELNPPFVPGVSFQYFIRQKEARNAKRRAISEDAGEQTGRVDS